MDRTAEPETQRLEITDEQYVEATGTPKSGQGITFGSGSDDGDDVQKDKKGRVGSLDSDLDSGDNVGSRDIL
jgi:hypothetical protein